MPGRAAEILVLRKKDQLRRRIWTLLTERGVARFPLPIHDRIPNFAGSTEAAERLLDLDEWQAAKRLKCNPDAPQAPVRLRALQAGKIVFMAVPRLRDERCFIRLDPAKLYGKLARAASISGASSLGEPVLPDALGRIDLVIAGSVAVDRRGGRVGKGGGYSDLEWALARELGIVDESTPVLSTVNELQLVRATIPMTPHDVPLDLIATPRRVIRTHREHEKPRGIIWADLSDTRVAAMPILKRIQERLRNRSRRA